MNIKKVFIGVSLVMTAMAGHSQSVFQVKQQSLPNPDNEPTAVFPVPSDRQMKWQETEFYAFFHYGMNTYTNREWGLGSEDVTLFAPTKKPNPAQWLKAVKAAGMKGGIAVVKHHDGFCMFDTKYTDFSIAHGPFGKDPRHNIAKEVFNAYRNKGFMIGCYFSKPDWHSKWFWNPYYATPNRRINYKKQQHPDWWQNYRKFTQNQLNELTTDYGNIDILWLDGGWITGEEIGLDTILVDARKRNPGMISVDRTIRGKNENYQTPEQGIPAKQLDIPWESCITLSHAWGWTPNAKFKSPNKVIGILSEIVAKGGCLALGVGPKADGTLQPEVVNTLLKIGSWLNKNGQAIYSTVNAAHYNDGKVWFTADKNGKTLYAIYALEDGEKTPKTITWTENKPKGKLVLLQNGKSVKYTVKGNQVTVTLPSGLKNEPLAFKFNFK